MFAADLWSLDQAGDTGDSDSAHQLSSLTSVGVTWTPDNTLYDTDRHRPLHNVTAGARLQRLNNTTRHCPPDSDKNDEEDAACYRTLADSMTAGAYQIKHDRVTVLSC